MALNRCGQRRRIPAPVATHVVLVPHHDPIALRAGQGRRVQHLLHRLVGVPGELRPRLPPGQRHHVVALRDPAQTGVGEERGHPQVHQRLAAELQPHPDPDGQHTHVAGMHGPQILRPPEVRGGEEPAGILVEHVDRRLHGVQESGGDDLGHVPLGLAHVGLPGRDHLRVGVHRRERGVLRLAGDLLGLQNEGDAGQEAKPVDPGGLELLVEDPRAVTLETAVTQEQVEHGPHMDRGDRPGDVHPAELAVRQLREELLDVVEDERLGADPHVVDERRVDIAAEHEVAEGEHEVVGRVDEDLHRVLERRVLHRVDARRLEQHREP
jgi:hypothetical protein